MRLIDADKLEIKHYVQRVSDKVIGYNGTQPKYANYDILAYDISNAPTVEAIPIEWIKEWFNTKMNNALLPRNYELLCSWIIYDWEAENDKG